MKGLKWPTFAWPKLSLPGRQLADEPSRPELNIPGLDQWAPRLLLRWRQLRRQFDARLLNERRLLIAATLALIAYLCDMTLITPAFEALKAARQREQLATMGRDAMQAELNRKRAELAQRLMAAQKEQVELRKRLADGEQELARQRSMMAPASDMQNLLEGLLAQHGQLQLKAMRTLPAVDVQFNGAKGGATPVLYSHGLEVSVCGPYLDLVAWLRSIEQLPRRLLWSGMTLSVADGALPTLTLQVQTFSPDRDPLEIAP